MRGGYPLCNVLEAVQVIGNAIVDTSAGRHRQMHYQAVATRLLRNDTDASRTVVGELGLPNRTGHMTKLNLFSEVSRGNKCRSKILTKERITGTVIANSKTIA